MLSFRGDAHKFYLKLRRVANKGNLKNLKEIKEVREIKEFYSTLNINTLEFTRYRILKEKSGSGIVPILVTTVPWILFIFGNKVQEIFAKDDNYLWLVFVFIYLGAVTFTVSIHFRERAWATVHLHILEDIINEKLDP